MGPAGLTSVRSQDELAGIRDLMGGTVFTPDTPPYAIGSSLSGGHHGQSPLPDVPMDS